MTPTIEAAVEGWQPQDDGPGLAAYLRRVVEKLSLEIGPRPWNEHSRLERAADFIAGELSGFGLAVTEQRFPFDGRTYRNVIGELTGGGAADPLLVVGAHYDTVRETPGADDNASGVAGLLGLAGLLARRPPGRTVRFAAFAPVSTMGGRALWEANTLGHRGELYAEHGDPDRSPPRGSRACSRATGGGSWRRSSSAPSS